MLDISLVILSRLVPLKISSGQKNELPNLFFFLMMNLVVIISRLLVTDIKVIQNWPKI